MVTCRNPPETKLVKIPAQTEEGLLRPHLMLRSYCGERRFFFGGIATGRSLMLQWVALQYAHIGSNRDYREEEKKEAEEEEKGVGGGWYEVGRRMY